MFPEFSPGCLFTGYWNKDPVTIGPWEHWTLGTYYIWSLEPRGRTTMGTQKLGHKGSWEHGLVLIQISFKQIPGGLVTIITFWMWSLIEQSVLIVTQFWWIASETCFSPPVCCDSVAAPPFTFCSTDPPPLTFPNVWKCSHSPHRHVVSSLKGSG